MARSLPGWALDGLAWILMLAMLLGVFAVLGIGFEADTMAHLLWGRELVEGQPLTRENPGNTSPKVLPILVSAAGHLLPGERTPEYFLALVTAAAGAGAVVLTMALARRIGGSGLAGLVAAPLVLGNMTFLRYVINGQSTILAAPFILGALVLATREGVTARTWIAAGVLVFLAGLARPEACVLGAALGLGAYLRLGWRRPGWPLVLLAMGLASMAAHFVLYRVGFGSFSYNLKLAVADAVLLRSNLPSLHVGFAVRVVKTIVYFANRSWTLLLLASIGAGLMLGPRDATGSPRWARLAVLALFPLATAAFQWLLVARKIWFNERIFCYLMFLVAALAAAAVAWLARWARESEQFLGVVVARWRAAGLVALVLAFLAPAYLSRPVPEAGKHFASVREMAAFMAERPRAQQPRIVATNSTCYVFYRLRLRPDDCALMSIKLLRSKDRALPPDVEWCVADDGDMSWELPESWGMTEVWEAPSGWARVFRRTSDDQKD